MTAKDPHGTLRLRWTGEPSDVRHLVRHSQSWRRLRARACVLLALLAAVGATATATGSRPPVLLVVVPLAVIALAIGLPLLLELAVRAHVPSRSRLSQPMEAIISPQDLRLVRGDGLQVTVPWSRIGSVEETDHAFLLHRSGPRGLYVLPKRATATRQELDIVRVRLLESIAGHR